MEQRPCFLNTKRMAWKKVFEIYIWPFFFFFKKELPQSSDAACFPDERSTLLSPLSLMILIGCVFVFIVGIVTLIGFIVHRRKEQKLLEAESYHPSSPSMWLNDLTGGNLLARASASHWADHPLDITSSSSNDFRRHDQSRSSHTLCDFRRLRDQRRRSFHSTSPYSDAPSCGFLDPVDAYPMHNLRGPVCGGDLRHNSFPHFACPMYKSCGAGGRLPRYGNTTFEMTENQNSDLTGRMHGDHFTGASAYP